MRRLRAIVVLLVLAAGAAALVLLARGAGEEDSNPAPHAKLRTPERLRARTEPTVAARPSRRVLRIADRLPVERRVAQLFLVGFPGTTVSAPIFADIQRLGWGGIAIAGENYETPDQLASLAGEAAVVARNARQLVPLVAAAGGVGGAFPDLGPAPQPELAGGGAGPVRAATRRAGARLREIGINLVFAPVADVGYSAGPADGLAFSDDPATVTRLTRAAVDGWLGGRIVSAVGHFPGQGSASQDPLDGPASVGIAQRDLEASDLQPFRAVAQTAPAMTVSNAAYAAFDSVTPATQTPAILRGLLRKRLGFAGVAISDDLNGAAAATGTTVADAGVAALTAGIDLLYIPDPAEVIPAYEAVLSAVRDGKLAPARVREALVRVLELKRAAGLL